MYLYAVVKMAPDSEFQAWSYRAANRNEREREAAGHYFVTPEEESDLVRPSQERSVYWVIDRTEADALARWLAATYPANTYTVMVVNNIYKAQVSDVQVRQHIEGQGILPL